MGWFFIVPISTSKRSTGWKKKKQWEDDDNVKLPEDDE